MVSSKIWVEEKRWKQPFDEHGAEVEYQRDGGNDVSG